MLAGGPHPATHHLPAASACCGRAARTNPDDARFMAQQHGFGRAVDEVAEDIEVEGLFDEVVRPVLEGGAGGGDIAVGRDHDGLGVGLAFAGHIKHDHAGISPIRRDGVFPTARGHAEVGDDDIKPTLAEFLERGLNTVDDGAYVPAASAAAQGLGHDLGMFGLIFDDEDLCPGLVLKG